MRISKITLIFFLCLAIAFCLITTPWWLLPLLSALGRNNQDLQNVTNLLTSFGVLVGFAGTILKLVFGLSRGAAEDAITNPVSTEEIEESAVNSNSGFIQGNQLAISATDAGIAAGRDIHIYTGAYTQPTPPPGNNQQESNTPIVNDLSNETVKRDRDVANIRNLLERLSTSIFDYFLEKLDNYITVHQIFHFHADVRAFASSGAFYIYDDSLRDLTQRFITDWDNALSFGNIAECITSGDLIIPSHNTPPDIWEKEKERYNEAIGRVCASYREWMMHIHEKYAEIDLNQTNEVAMNNYQTRNMETRQHLVKVEWRRSQTITKQLASDLYVVNCDTQPVSNIHVDFFINVDDEKAMLSWPCPCLPPGGESLVQQYTRGQPGPKYASLTYVDASGHQHGPYVQDRILKAC